MAAGITIKHKRKAGAFSNGELAAGEWGLDTTNSTWYYSANGTTVEELSSGPGGGVSEELAIAYAVALG